MNQLTILKCQTNKGVNQIYITYNETTLEAETIVWYCTDKDHSCVAVRTLSEQNNLTRETMILVDENTYEFVLPTGLYLEYDEMGDLTTTNVEEYLKNR